jgi:putative DNA primase/helicase
MNSRQTNAAVDRIQEDPIHAAFENPMHVTSNSTPPSGDPSIIEVTEDGVAREVVRRRSGEIKFDHQKKAWFVWDKDKWRQDNRKEVYQYCRETAREASENASYKERRAMRKANFPSGVERLVQSDRDVAVSGNYWDLDPMLLGCPKVTVNLRTGKPINPSPKDGITKQCGVTPSPGDCSLWRKFLMDASGGDEDVVGFIQVWFGYLLTGETSEHSLLFVYGPGGNGKSVFLNIISRILGDYAVTAGMDTFTKSRGDRHPTDLAMLRGARSVSASETEEGRSWAESRIKQMTGGDEITARFMHRDFFTSRPNFKLTIVGNHYPVLSDVDPAVRRRFLILPFTKRPPEPDHELWAEAPQILSWAIRGCLDWQDRGLPRPQAVVSATEQYFEDQDIFGQWFQECCRAGRTNDFKTSADLYKSWKWFSEGAGEDAGTRQGLGQRLRRNGFVSAQKRVVDKNCEGWTGIALVDRSGL